MRNNLSTKEVAVLVRQELKKVMPQCKFSVTYKSFSMGSSLTVALVSGPAPVLEDSGYVQLNKYSFYDNKRRGTLHLKNNGATLTHSGYDIMATAIDVVDQYHWDESDIQSDYFCCNFYAHFEIGKWNQDYQRIEVSNSKEIK